MFLIRIFGKVGMDKKFSEGDFKNFFDSVDLSRNGYISKGEMRAFFLKLSKQTLKIRQVRLQRSHSSGEII